MYSNDEESKKRRLEGNIYVGEVKDILTGMQAAFVDFGENKKGFIHLKDSIPQLDQKEQKVDDNLKISDILKPKQKILIQVKKDSDDRKGARVSTHISLPGKYIVLMPNTSFITISQKIDNEKVREDLSTLVKQMLPKGFGAVIRTSAKMAKKEEIDREIKSLINKWKNIEDKFKKNQNKLQMLYESENIVEKLITDLSTKKLEKIITNSKSEYDKLKKLIELEGLSINVLFEDNCNLLDKYDMQKQIEKSLNRKIWLNCGGFITIDKTEALTAIDVNTGKFTGKKDLEATVFKVNKEATVEIAKQLRLRDIGGIIIIDYIDMKNEENKKKIEALLKEALKEDRAKTQVEGFTKLNLMEMTRKHICSHLNSLH